MSSTTFYAIGDVHGELDKLDYLLAAIESDAQLTARESKIVFLGDLVDRGPDSRGVVVSAMQLCADGRAVAVMGNHEAMMIHAFDDFRMDPFAHWTLNGGDETIASYELTNGRRSNWREAVDKEHIDWMKGLPLIIHDEARKLVFVHAGIDPRTFPACDDDHYLWTRSNRFFDPGRWPDRPELEGLRVIHGHTPTSDLQPHVDARRVNVDTGACYGGPLTCVVLAPEERIRFLSVA